MNRSRWQRIKEIAEAAFALPRQHQRRFIEAACENDASLTAEILQLLANDRASPGFLQPPSFGHFVQRDPTPPPPRSPERSFAAGTQIAGRYTLRDALGRGSSGVVHEAYDEVAKREVAIKLLPGLQDDALSVLRRESATLRWLRLPGVVQLIDDGVDGDVAFIVMERVHGEPFPGSEGARSWEDIAEPVLALLETLARIHWAGVIHRDLKPHNVLVDRAGVPTLLDLGLSVGPTIVWDSDEGVTAAGTPRYAAPEQLAGAAPSVRADLYSVGVMMFYAMTGRLPHDASSLMMLITQRLTISPPSLAELGCDVPPHVSEVVGRLLEVDPANRPCSASEAWSLLRRTPGGAQRELPWLGRRDHLLSIVGAAKARARLDVAGRRGSGRTRCLSEAASLLEEEGYEVVWLPPGDTPFASLAGLLGDALSGQEDGLEQTSRRVDDELARGLESGLVLIADDFQLLDRWSAERLAACPAAGCIVRALTNAEGAQIQLDRLDEEALRELFAGPDRLHHLREDAAHQLARRTGGWPDRVSRELEAWVRAGLARREGDSFVVLRSSLERLDVGGQVAPWEHTEDSGPELAPRLSELLGLIGIAAPRADPELLIAVAQQPRWLVEAGIDELIRMELVRATDDGKLTARGAGHHQSWHRERKRDAHAAIAAWTPSGSPGRLLHLVASEQFDAVPAEATVVARRLLRDGAVERASFVLDEGLRSLGTETGVDAVIDLLTLSLKAALAAGTTKALDYLIYQIQRLDLRHPVSAQIETLARAGLQTLDGDSQWSLEAVAAMRDCPPTLAHSRAAVHVLAARYTSLDAQSAAVAEATAWAEVEGTPAARAAAMQWEGWLRYGSREYEAATRLHMRAASLAPEAPGRLTALLAAASAALEGFDLENAAVIARRARAQARELRIPNHEAQAECLLRSAAYRLDEAGAPDLELVDALRELGVPQLEAQGCLTEAAVAWRLGQRGLARTMAQRAADEWGRAGLVWPSALAESLAIVCGADPVRIEVLTADIESCPIPGIALQVLGLATRVQPAGGPDRGDFVESLAGLLPRSHWHVRREVVSVDEVVQWLGRAGGAEEKGRT